MSRQAFQLDVVAEAPGEQGGGVPRLLAIGEARSGERPRTMSDLARLERLRGLLSTRADASGARLLLFGRSGFEADLVAAAGCRTDVELIDLERLYEGD